MTKWVGLGSFISMAALVAWAVWGPFLQWCWAQLPANASWYSLAKILIVFVFGFSGGICIPLMLISFGIQFYICVK